MRTLLARIAVVLAVFGATLVPAWAAPAETIFVPITLARSVHVLSGHYERIDLDYPATHIAFSWIGRRGSTVRYRTTAEDGSASAWRRVPETHGSLWAERNHRHFSAVLVVEGVTRVEWRGAGSRAGTIRRVTLDYLNTLDGPRREVRIPAVADATDSPMVVTRARWGADESLKRTSGGCTRRFFKLQQIFVHHTAGRNYDSDPAATMRAIYWYHVARQGWCDIGYNFVIAPDGTVFEGRWARRYKPWELHDAEDPSGRVVAGAHTESYNSGSLGVSLMGNFSQVPLPPAARRSLIELLAWEVDRHRLDPRARHVFRNPETGTTKTLRYIAGHRDAGQTACPGSYVYRDLPEIRREVEAARGAGRASSSITLAAESTAVPYGEPAGFTGTLSDHAGRALVAQRVTSYMREANRRWKPGPETITDEEGNFRLEAEVTRNTKIIAIYEGDAATWGAQSLPASVRIAPLVTIEAEGGTPDTAGVSHHPSGTEEIYLTGSVDPPHINRSVVVRVSRLQQDGSYELVTKGVAELDDLSDYRFRFEVEAGGGTSRAVTAFGADEDHAGARSEPVTMIVDP